MGIGSFFKKLVGRGKKEVVEQATYILKRQNPEGRGMIKVAALAEPSTADELYPTLEAGIYALHKYIKGQTGFDVVWGPIEVIGKGTVGVKSESIEPTAGMALADFLKKFDEVKEVAEKEYEILGAFFGAGFKGGKSEEIDIIDLIFKAKDKYVKLGEIFGSKTTTTDEEPVKYKGELPIWMHPKVIDAIIEQPLARIEAFLKRTGLTSAEGEVIAPPQGDMINLPPKPAKKVDTPPPPKDDDSSFSLDDKLDKEDKGEDDDESKAEE